MAVTPGQTYYLAFDSTASLTVSGEPSSVYPDGQAYANSGYQPYPTLDYAFRTYAETVPEPGAWAMMILGFGLSGSAVRYRRRTMRGAYA